MELVRHPNDHSFDLRIGEHRFVVCVRNLRIVDGSHPLNEIFCGVADGVQCGVARLSTGLEVGELRDRSATEHPHPQES